MQYVLTERFCQDSVEEYFGNQRKFGQRIDNPEIAFGYNNNTIRVQRAVSRHLATHEGEKTGTKHGLMFLITQFQRRRVKS